MQLVLEQIIHYALFGVLVPGGILLVWIIIVGFPLIVLTPQAVRAYRFGGADCTEVEKHLATGWDLVAIILRFSVAANVAFPWLGKKRGLSKIRDVSPSWFTIYSFVFYVVTCLLSVIITVSALIMTFDVYVLRFE